MSERLRKAASDFWWVPSHVCVIEEPLITISHTTEPGHYNFVVPHGEIDPEFEVNRVAKLHPKTSRWWLTEVCDGDRLRGLLGASNYQEDGNYGAYVLDLATATLNAPDVEISEVKTETQMRDMYKARCDIFGNEAPTDSQIALELSQCTGPEARVARFAAYDAEFCVGTGSVTYFDQLSFAFIWAGGIREVYRGKGWYKALLKARAQACLARGIRYMGLYANLETSAPVVAAHGFEECGYLTYYELTQ